MSDAIRLTTAQMAEFAARGVLRFDGVVPEAINEQFCAELEACLTPERLRAQARHDPAAVYGALLEHEALPFVDPGTPWRSAFARGTALGDLLRLPLVAGAVESLVGPAAVVDHHFLHVMFPPPPGRPDVAQHYHQDSTIDPRKAFDVQIMYYPHAVTATMGGTRYLPGSHLRIVSESAIARYQNLRGQQHVVCAPGTLLFLHHGLWHGGGANRGDQHRYMWKLRLAPREPQVRLWDTRDLAADSNRQQPIFWSDPAAARDPVQARLTTPEPWFEADVERLEFINRARFWRRLSGDDNFDADYWLTRLENEYPV